MDIEVFYHSSLRKWIFAAIGLLAIIVGSINVFLFFWWFLFKHAPLFSIPIFASINIIWLGILILLVAFNCKKTACILSIFLFFLIVARIIILYSIEDLPIYHSLAKIIMPNHSGSLANFSLISGIIFIALDVALFFLTLDSLQEWPLWVSGIFASIALGISLYFVSYNLTKLKLIPFAAMHLSSTTAIMALLIALAFFFYAGSQLLYFYPHHFVWWLPTFIALVALALTMTTWLTMQAKEREQVIKENEENLQSIQEQILERGKFYLGVLNRMRKRWGNLGLETLKSNDYLNIESDIFSSFPFLYEFGLIQEEKKIIERKSNSAFQAPADLFSLINKNVTNTTEAGPKFIFARNPTEKEIEMVFYAPFTTQELVAKSFFFAISSADGYFSYSIQPLLRKQSVILITSSQEVLYASNAEDQKHQKRYRSQAKLDFFGIPLNIEVWPLSNYLSSAPFPYAYYNFGIGLIFTLTLFFAVALALLAYQKKKAADKANKEKTMFLANMSHEIRTPLHGILGSCSLLEVTPVNDYQKKWIGAISKSGRMLLSLVDDLLDLSKIETASVKLEPRNINLKNLINEIITLLMPDAEAKNLKLKFHYDESLSETVYIDGKRIRQILANLLDNGIKYTNQGYVSLDVTQNLKTNELIFKVEDSGIGIPEPYVKTLFTKYLTIDIRSEKGSGLGLAIVRRLVQLMGGQIEAQSQQNKGSVFTVKIPMNNHLATGPSPS